MFWLGYDAPAWSETFGDNSVLLPDAAIKGAPDLVRHSQGLKATSNGNPRLVLSAHSYGTEVAFYALADRKHCFDTAVLSGSPGYPRTPVHLDRDDLYLATNPTDGPAARVGDIRHG